MVGGVKSFTQVLQVLGRQPRNNQLIATMTIDPAPGTPGQQTGGDREGPDGHPDRGLPALHSRDRHQAVGTARQLADMLTSADAAVVSPGDRSIARRSVQAVTGWR